ncbi:protein FAR1-RELATED SEQUENCE 5-like [Arachis duranensis]|uniref:Protein FAR1-RELATED SEQUENCE 5-like n=1 Tax=Arachis duranensis TaxID=130453 RepID=A0A6P4C5X4_ARADU|nr:protein FAR1-RELATED SEQUENCE 5-like [Arachis duranensis]
MGSVHKNSTESSVEFDDLSFEYSGSSEENDINISQKKGTIDEAMKMVDRGDGFGEVEKKLTELTRDDIWGIEHDSVEECVQFYKNYAKVHGFVARCDEKGYDFNGNLNMRQMVCNREGTRRKKYLEMENRKRDHRPITRVMCQARIRFHYDMKLRKWKVTAFEETHNHDLIPPKYIQFVPAYRVMTEADKAQANSLHDYGVRTCHIMGFMLKQKGGPGKIGFTKKDLYNHFDKSKRAKVKDGDAYAALSYLISKADEDPLLQGKFTLKDNKLENLVWADGASIIDYQCFSDVLAFDTTYQKNKYNKPLVVFSGTNHHGQTCIFGCGLLADEKHETYVLVLKMFLEIMGNKHPTAVVTDGDLAMRGAIREVMPNATHRLCAWHLHRNACEAIKNSEFLHGLKHLMYGNFFPDEFEDKWHRLVSKFKLSENEWVKKTYEIKRMWASAYLNDTFFGRIRTTSQCEGIHSLIKHYIDKKCYLLDLMHNLNEAVRQYRTNELLSDFKSLFSSPVLTTCFEDIEKEAANIFTHNMFKEVRNEILEASKLNVVGHSIDGNKIEVRMNKYQEPAIEYKVRYDRSTNNFACDCRLFESRGIPCSHIFCTMRHDHISTIPNTLIHKRWTKDAKKEYISSLTAEDIESEKIAGVRYGALATLCFSLCDKASKHRDDFMEIREDIFGLIMKLHKRHNPNDKLPSTANLVGDPSVVKTKGAPRQTTKTAKARKCSHCKRIGHTVRRCPKLYGGECSLNSNEDKLNTDIDQSSTESNGDTKKVNKPHVQSTEVQSNQYNDNRTEKATAQTKINAPEATFADTKKDRISSVEKSKKRKRLDNNRIEKGRKPNEADHEEVPPEIGTYGAISSTKGIERFQCMNRLPMYPSFNGYPMPPFYSYSGGRTPMFQINPSQANVPNYYYYWNARVQDFKKKKN